uniref:Uncharacterized protein n=1 Tax=Peronospora matthiolae TaxID=2874970 RepID=A0AAV1T9I0_9STRA
MHRPRVVLLHALMVLAAMWAQANPVTKKVASIEATPGVASWTTSGRFLRGEEVKERAISSSQISVSPFKRLSEWLSSKVDKLTRSPARRFSRKRLEDLFLQKYLEARVDDDLFSPTVYSWVARIDRFNNDNPQYKISPAKLLAKDSSHLELARKIEKGLLISDDRELATRLAESQRECWKDDGRSAMKVFRLLELDKPGRSIFERPELNTWYDYVLIRNKNEGRAKQEMASLLVNTFSVDELNDAFGAALSKNERSQQTYLKLAGAVIRYQDLHQLSEI